ncbi:MAG: carotenoid biosynthesis protein [Bacteroidota bacterium]|nr:carotenoid biosynthesis protein [Bacteroidota bacterium]
MEKQTIRYLIGGIVLIIFHIIGAIGLRSPDFSDYMASLTWFHILVSAACIFLTQKRFPDGQVLRVLIVFVAGYLIEVIGTNTGYPFGAYNYGTNLGVKLFNTPIILGVNWVILSYGASNIVSQLYIRVWIKALFGGILMVIFDFMLEPFAIYFKLWEWQTVDGLPPVQNYIFWFVFGFIFCYLLSYSRKQVINPVAQLGFIIYLFFVGSFIPQL